MTFDNISPAQARQIMRDLSALRKSRVDLIATINRKRSWPPATRAMAAADHMQTLESLKTLEALIGTHFRIGGY